MEKLYEYIDKTHNTAFFVVLFGIAIIIFGGFTFLLRTTSPKAAQQVRVTEEILTVQMNPSVLKDALRERAADWCSVDHSLLGLGDITISNTSDGIAMYNKVFLTDSVAPLMAREYPHLYQYKEEDGLRSFTMSASRTSVTVPVWLVKALIDLNILQLPKDLPTQNK
jgi:hypothetical protein